MEIDYGQILPAPTDAPYDSSRSYIGGETCLDEYQSEWLSLEDGNRGHALPGYNADGSAKVSQWWRCIVNVRRAAVAASNADEQAAEAELQASRANNYLNALSDEISEEAKAKMVMWMLTPHVEGSTLVFPANSVAHVNGSTLILTE